MPVKWRVVAMLWCIAFFNYADRQAIFSVFPLLEREMHLTAVQLGLLGSGFAWVYGLAAPLAGFVVDRTSRRKVILGGLHAWSAICMATALSRTFLHLFLFRAAEGLGETFYFPASTSLMSDYHGRRTRSRALGLHQTSVYVGTIAGGFFAGLIAERSGWRLSFVVFGALGVLLGLVLSHALPDAPATGGPLGTAAASSSEAESGSPLRGAAPAPTEWGGGRLWASAPLLCLLGAFMCANFVAVVLLSWMPKFLFDRFHMSLSTAGLTATAFVQLASLAGAPVGGWLADWWRQRSPAGRVGIQAIGMFAGAPCVAICGLTSSVTTLIAALTCWGFCKGLYDANIFASAFDLVPPSARGRTAGLMNMIGWLAGGGSAPLVIGLVAERSSLGAAMALSSVVYVAAGVLLVAAAALGPVNPLSRDP
jgi:MFS family permease